MRRNRGGAGRWLVLGLLLVAVGAAVFAVLARRGGGTAQRTAVEPLAQGLFVRDVSGTGVVQAARRRSLGFRQSGTVAEVLVEEGQQVAAGAVLARLEMAARERDLAANRASLQSARAELQRIEAQQRVDRLDVAAAVTGAENELAAAQEARQEAAGTLATTERLVAAGAASQDELRAAQDALAQAERRVSAAEIALEQARTRSAAFDQLAAAQRAGAEAQISSLETADLNLEQELAEAVLSAPFAGIVTDIGFEAGDSVAPGQGTLELVDTSRLSVEARFDENRALELAPGQAALVIPDADTGRELPAVVARVSAVADRSQNSAQIEAELDFAAAARPALEAGLIRPGYTVTVEVVVNRLENVLLVPLEAVSEADGQSWVYRINPAAPGEGTAERVAIEVADRNATVAAVTGGGLRPGDLIAVVNTGELSDGAPVEYAPPPRPGGAG